MIFLYIYRDSIERYQTIIIILSFIVLNFFAIIVKI